MVGKKQFDFSLQDKNYSLHIYYLEFFGRKELVLLSHLFSYLFISVWACRYLFYSLGCHSILLLFIVAQITPALVTETFQGGSCVLLTCLLSFFFFSFLFKAFPYFPTPQNASGSSCIFTNSLLE